MITDVTSSFCASASSVIQHNLFGFLPVYLHINSTVMCFSLAQNFDLQMQLTFQSLETFIINRNLAVVTESLGTLDNHGDKGLINFSAEKYSPVTKTPFSSGFDLYIGHICCRDKHSLELVASTLEHWASMSRPNNEVASLKELSQWSLKHSSPSHHTLNHISNIARLPAFSCMRLAESKSRLHTRWIS